jgi:hypothetical protein
MYTLVHAQSAHARETFTEQENGSFSKACVHVRHVSPGRGRWGLGKAAGNFSIGGVLGRAAPINIEREKAEAAA